MTITLENISHQKYIEDKEIIGELIEKIWINKSNSERCKFVIDRWAKEKRQDYYFYILQNNKPIGITGFYPIEPKKGYYGLNHTGTIQKGTGKPTFDILIKIIKKLHNNAKTISEIIPTRREDLIQTFQKWGFEQDTKDKYKQLEYKDDKGNKIYKYLMIRKIN